MLTVPSWVRPGALALFTLWSVAASVAGAAEPARYPWVIGHRGGSVLRPENTLPAYDFTLDEGATGVEFDVWLSLDGFPVCHHDATVDRTTNGTGFIYAKDLAEIRTLDAGSWFAPEYTGTLVPTFEEGLAEVQGRGKLFLDIKSISYVPTFVQYLEDFGFDPDDVWIWERFGTGAPFEALMPAAHVVAVMNLARDREEWLLLRIGQGFDGIDEVYKDLTKDYVDLVHSYGMLMMSHTVVSPRFQAQKDMGVDIIVAGHPTLFAEQHFPAPISVCTDGIDNDGDGLTDYPDDPSCWGDAAQTEVTACSDGIDNDGDGLTDHPADPGCYAPFYTLEDPQCSDGIDNNGDGDVDYPADAGCLAAYDQGEQAACANGIDDDGDGFTDYPADPGCYTPTGNNEQPECNDGLDNDGDGAADYPLDSGCLYPGDVTEHLWVPTCNDGVDNDGDGLTDYHEDPECLGPNDFTESGECSDGIDNDGDGLTDLQDPDCLTGSDPTEQAECRDGLDDDGDGLIDLLDPGCRGSPDGTEAPDCSDGFDNDGDGDIDYPNDPDCESSNDRSEDPACRDGIDNDENGLIDYPADLHCDSADDPAEMPECRDGVDNDGDNDVDGADSGCWGAEDSTEEPDCSDGLDNDGDGLVDYPADPQCANTAAPFEWLVAPTPALSPAGAGIAAALMGVGAWALRRPRRR